MTLFFSLTLTPTPEIYTLSLHDALPIFRAGARRGQRGAQGRAPPHRTRHRAVGGEGRRARRRARRPSPPTARSEEHTSELQSHSDLVCRLLLEKKKKNNKKK